MSASSSRTAARDSARQHADALGRTRFQGIPDWPPISPYERTLHVDCQHHRQPKDDGSAVDEHYTIRNGDITDAVDAAALCLTITCRGIPQSLSGSEVIGVIRLADFAGGSLELA
jgi:hypothetical protein